MPVGVSLGALVDQLRHEIGASTGAGQGVNVRDAQKHTLRTTQQRLHDEWAWPHMVVETDESILAGQRYYTFDPTLLFQRVQWTKVKWNTSWLPVFERADFTELYNSQDSDEDERADPIQFWRHYDTGQYEVWPLPESAQTLRWRGTKKLNDLVAEDDIAELDDRVIVLFAAARWLKRLKSMDADNVLAEANSHLNRLKGQGIKRGQSVVGGCTQRAGGFPGGDWTVRTNRIA